MTPASSSQPRSRASSTPTPPPISVASLVATTSLPPDGAIAPILVAMSCNALSKSVVAFGAGSAGYSLRVIPGIVLSMAAAWAFAVPALLGIEFGAGR